MVMSSSKQRDDTNLAIVHYLESHGYAQSASIFRQEANVPQFCNTPVSAPPGAILQPKDGGGGGAINSYIAPSMVTVTGAPMLSRGPTDNTYHHHPPTAATMYSPQCITMGFAPQSFFVHNHPNAATNFPLTTGQFTHNLAVPNIPNIHVKSRVYVPNQIVGILIGTKGQTIKSISAESGAMISIEGGDRDRQQKKVSVGGRGAEGTAEKENTAGAVTAVVVVDDEADGGKIAAADSDRIVDNAVVAEHQSASEIVVVAVEEGDSDSQQKKKLNGGGGEGTADKENAVSAVTTAIVAAVDEADGRMTTITTTAVAANNRCGVENAMVTGQQHVSAVVASHLQQRLYDSTSPRPVFIQGYDYQVSKAQYWVFQKVAESQSKNMDEIELACEAIVPSRVIGRIIGKGGHNVKKLQMSSGARIKVPDDIRGNNKGNVDWATVSIYGNYYAVQTVQQHFGSLISEVDWRDSREHDERRARLWNGVNSNSR